MPEAMSLDGSSVYGSGSTTVIEGDESDSTTIEDAVLPASSVYESSDFELCTDDLKSNSSGDRQQATTSGPSLFFRYAPSFVSGGKTILTRDDRTLLAVEEQGKYPVEEYDESLLEDLAEWEEMSECDTQIERTLTTQKEEEGPILLFRRKDVRPKRKTKVEEFPITRTVIPYPVPKYWAHHIRPYVSDADLEEGKTTFDLCLFF